MIESLPVISNSMLEIPAYYYFKPIYALFELFGISE
jgi:hypothetical protein